MSYRHRRVMRDLKLSMKMCRVRAKTEVKFVNAQIDERQGASQHMWANISLKHFFTTIWTFHKSLTSDKHVVAAVQIILKILVIFCVFRRCVH